MSAQLLSFIVHLPARAGHVAELEASVRQVLHAMSAEPDFVHCVLHRSQGAPDTLVVYETWRCSREHFLSTHLGRDYRAAFEARLPELLGAARRIEFLDQADPPLELRAPGAQAG
jgi:quinol monooxygenase YgiN